MDELRKQCKSLVGSISMARTHEQAVDTVLTFVKEQCKEALKEAGVEECQSVGRKTR